MSGQNTGVDVSGIAIIGMAGRFPGAANLRDFWTNLRDGKESIRFFTIDELIAAGVDRDLCQNPRYVPARGVLDDVDQFDARFFGYTPREAELIDPQQRLFLECASMALENAGYGAPDCDVPVGVFAGQSINTYSLLRAFDTAARSMGDLDVLSSSDKDFLTTRVSYKLDLRGPSIVIQTACSTSLVAVSQACKSLVSSECDMALAGGVSASGARVGGYLYQEGSIRSPDGHTRPFDADSSGCVSGEGVGVVVLKRLADALADGDTIRAVIRGWAVNNDGSLKVGYTAPSEDGQAEAIATAQGLAGVEPGDISYVEAHGTGTSIGDPIEVAGLSQVFGSRRGGRPACGIGSVKSNIGHLDAAAGVAGLMKTVLALQHREVPGTLHFKQVNPKIDLDSTPFYVTAQGRPWSDCPLPRRAGVSSFGAGGTNAHVVLEEAPAREASSASRTRQLLLLSAKSADALDDATHQLADALQGEGERPLADVAYTLALGRRRFSHRRAIVCRDYEHANTVLRGHGDGGMLGAHCESSGRPVAFMFPGGGAQHLRMGLELYETERVFREEMDRCATLIEPALDCDLRELLYRSPDGDEAAVERLTQLAVALPALFAVEYSLAHLWMSWGVQPDAMIGHSLGEYVAACLAGVFSLEDGLKLVVARARLMQSVPAGAMVSAALPPERLSSMLEDGASIAAVNEPSSCVVSGTIDAISALEARLASEGVANRRLHIHHAGHSEMMEPIQEALGEEVARVALKPPQIPFVSNVTGTWIRAGEASDPQYWVRHLRETVRFSDGVATLLAEGERILLEVGPGNGLTGLAGRHPARRTQDMFIASMRHPRDEESDVEVVIGAAARLWLAGADLDWREYYREERRQRVPLPTYPFERTRYWVGGSNGRSPTGPAQGAARGRLPMREWFSAPSWKRAPAPAGDPIALGEQARERWLVFADACGVAEAMVGRLRSGGAAVVEVRVGEGFAARGDAGFTLDPGRPEHYAALMKALGSGAGFPSRIVHLLGVTGSNPLSREGLLERCFYGPMFLAQAIGHLDMAARASVLFVSDDVQEVTGDENICPEKSTLLGPSRVIPLEYPNIGCRFVDIPGLGTGTAGADWVADRLICEAALDDDASVVAYRGKHRWLQSLERLDLQRAVGPRGGLRPGGVYLITGGLGGVGLALAKGIASEVRAKLVLLGRSPLPPRPQWNDLAASGVTDEATTRRVAAVQALEALGADVMVVAADVSEADQVRRALEAVRQRHGEINGVIHSAGVGGGGVIHLKTREAAHEVLAPKVQGTSVLLDALEGSKPDFILLCSSVAAITGVPGLVDYTAANAHLDAVAQRLRQTGAAAAVSVNWGTWRESGMAVDTIVPRSLEASRSARVSTGMTAAEGVDAFLRIIASGYSQVAVSTRSIDLPGGEGRAASPAAGPRADQRTDDTDAPLREAVPTDGHVRPALSTEYVAPRDDIEGAIVAIWGDLLGFSSVGVHDDFFELGGHSLVAVQVLARVNAEFEVQVPLKGFFARPTIGALAQLVREAASGSVDEAAGLAGFTEIVDQLSDEDVQRLLEEHGEESTGK